MKKLLPLGLILVSAALCAQTPLSQSLKDPSHTRSLVMGRSKNDAADLMKNRSSFRVLTSVVIEGVNDSMELEQDILSIAAIPGVKKVVLKNCSVAQLSNAMHTLTGVTHVEILNCDKMEKSAIYDVVSGMRSVRSFTLVTSHMETIPKSFRSLSGLNEVSIINNDRALADAYELNNSSAEDLVVMDSLSLGFGSDVLHLSYSSYDAGFTKQHIDIMRNILQGEVFAGDAYVLPHRPSIFKKQNSLVKPPVAGLDVAMSMYEVKSSNGGTIAYPSGTRITIPANAFVDANGQIVSGTVNIGYREFRDQVDIMLSGIPMDYDSAGVNGHFVSAGMFDINASVDGKEVYLADGKEVKMNFAVVDTAANFNFYQLDPQKGWIYQNSPGKTEDASGNQPTTIALPSVAVQYYWDNIRKVNTRRPGEFDPTMFEDRYNDLNYIYDEHKTDTYIKANRRTNSINKFRAHKMYHHRDTTCFRIERLGNFNYNDPELHAFSGYSWMTTDNVRSQALKGVFRKKSLAHDMRIYEEGDGFVLEFKTTQGFTRIHAQLVRMLNGKPKEVSTRNSNRMFRLYTRMLASRKGYMDRSIARREKRRDHWKEWAKADSLKVWNKARPKMTTAEAALDQDAWIAYFKKEFPKILNNGLNSFSYAVIRAGAGEAGTANAAMLYQALSIASFGIYNCDHCGDLPKPIATNAHIQNGPNGDVAAVNIYVIDRDVNTSTTFSSLSGKDVNITYNEPSKNSLFIIDKEGKLYTVKSADFAKGNRMGGSTRYQSTLISDKAATPEQLRDMLFEEE